MYYFDINGDSVSTIISSGSFVPNGSNSLAGHVAINVDGVVYSFEGDGKWKKYKYSDYIKNEKADRYVVEITVNVDQEKVQAALDNRKDGVYNTCTNSCVTNSIEVLSQGGISVNKTDGAVTPNQLSNSLLYSEYAKTIQKYEPLFDKSLTRRLFIGAINTLGLTEMLSGIKINSNNILKNLQNYWTPRF